MIDNEGGVHQWNLTVEQTHNVRYVRAHLLRLCAERTLNFRVVTSA